MKIFFPLAICILFTFTNQVIVEDVYDDDSIYSFDNNDLYSVKSGDSFSIKDDFGGFSVEDDEILSINYFHKYLRNGSAKTLTSFKAQKAGMTSIKQSIYSHNEKSFITKTLNVIVLDK